MFLCPWVWDLEGRRNLWMQLGRFHLPIPIRELNWDNALPQAGQFPLRQYPKGINVQGQPAKFIWMHSTFSTCNIFNWKNCNPPYMKDPIRMSELCSSVFVTYHPSLADIQILMNMMLTGDERRMVINTTKLEGAQGFQRMWGTLSVFPNRSPSYNRQWGAH